MRLENDSPKPGNRRLVEGDHRVAERDDEQQLGEAEHVLARLAPGEHHADAVPHEQDRGEGQEHPIANGDELRLLRRQQARDGLLDGADRVVAGGRRHGQAPQNGRQPSMSAAVWLNRSSP